MHAHTRNTHGKWGKKEKNAAEFQKEIYTLIEGRDRALTGVWPTEDCHYERAALGVDVLITHQLPGFMSLWYPLPWSTNGGGSDLCRVTEEMGGTLVTRKPGKRLCPARNML